MKVGKVLVTGGRGFVGQTFIDSFKDNCDLISLIRSCPSESFEHHVDLLNFSSYENILDDVEVVVWFAANRSHFTTESELRSDNVDTVKHFLTGISSLEKSPLFIYISTISVSPDPSERKIDSIPDSPYGFSKLSAESEVKKSGLPFIILRLPFMYGNGFAKGSHLDFWRKLARIPLLSLRFSGNLSLLHTKDLASLLILIAKESAIQKAFLGKVLYISDGLKHSVNDLITNVERLQARKSKVKVNVPRLLLSVMSILIPAKSFRYWVRLLVGDAFYLERSTEFEGLEMEYLCLYDGLTLSYQKANKAVDSTRYRA